MIAQNLYLSATVVSNIDAESINLLYKVIWDKFNSDRMSAPS